MGEKRIFGVNWKGSVIPKGAEVEVVRHLAQGKTIVDYKGDRYWVYTRFLRKKGITKQSPKPPRNLAYTKPEMKLFLALQKHKIPFQSNVAFYDPILEKPHYSVDCIICGFLPVEVDGPHHDKPRVKIRDNEKEESLKRKGYAPTLRFPVEEIMKNIDKVIMTIKEKIKV